ncbi:hypothetical protein [Vibrio cholerae]|uniref:hypothetical protein n=1 Tax=Vibrio cholerae TaxID=666 RepID=UPI0000F34D4D|nr:hypothetical protein [Vibrio cholerae]APF77640.1 hypothetical protein ASZ85_00031 [Vibrio cholerae]EAZ74469.1 conserved hypothetical protein [Vibrio cholerae NCTC 8457]GHZ83107.1 hypothetical protein VCSRO176_3148 [Vibrio cholerae]
MSKKRLPENDLLEELSNFTGQSDELARTSEKNWGAYSKHADKADSDFLVNRIYVFDSYIIELERGEQDRELVKKRKNSVENDVDIDDF